METRKAFALGEANRGKESMVFDWDKAARLIKKKDPKVAAAGLELDWDWTGGDIYADGKIIPEDKTYVYLASTWAIPQLDMDGEVVACFRMKSETPGWNQKTYWPKSSRKLLT